MINGINGSSGYSTQMQIQRRQRPESEQMQGMQRHQRPESGQMQGMQRRQRAASGQMQGMQGQAQGFNKLDVDGSGTIDQEELQGLADKYSEITGQQLDVEAITSTYDINSDGVLGQDEMQSMQEDLHEQMISAYQTFPEQDLSTDLVDISDNSDDDADEYNPVNIQV